jgi:hypothetical protein
MALGSDALFGAVVAYASSESELQCSTNNSETIFFNHMILVEKKPTGIRILLSPPRTKWKKATLGWPFFIVSWRREARRLRASRSRQGGRFKSRRRAGRSGPTERGRIAHLPSPRATTPRAEEARCTSYSTTPVPHCCVVDSKAEGDRRKPSLKHGLHRIRPCRIARPPYTDFSKLRNIDSSV